MRRRFLATFTTDDSTIFLGALLGAVNHDGTLIATRQKNTWIFADDKRVYNLRGEGIHADALVGALICRVTAKEAEVDEQLGFFNRATMMTMTTTIMRRHA